MNFFAISFVVDIESRKDAQLLLACLNGADSYNKLQLRKVYSRKISLAII